MVTRLDALIYGSKLELLYLHAERAGIRNKPGGFGKHQSPHRFCTFLYGATVCQVLIFFHRGLQYIQYTVSISR